MADLLETYSLTQILMFIIIFALAIKEIVTFWDWAKNRLGQVFDKDYQKKEEKAGLEERLHKGSETMKNLTKQLDQISKDMAAVTQKVDMLIESDKDDIKSYLTDKYHIHCEQKGWIDYYSMDCCEKRFAHYEDEGGNSFIGGMMKKLRELPKQPPADHSDLTK